MDSQIKNQLGLKTKYEPFLSQRIVYIYAYHRGNRKGVLPLALLTYVLGGVCLSPNECGRLCCCRREVAEWRLWEGRCASFSGNCLGLSSTVHNALDRDNPTIPTRRVRSPMTHSRRASGNASPIMLIQTRCGSRDSLYNLVSPSLSSPSPPFATVIFQSS